MSLVAIYRSKNTIDSDIHYIEKIMEYIELEKCIKEEKKVTTKIIPYEQAVKDILETLPKGSAKVIDEPIDNKVVIKIQKNVFME
jgi:two component system response regulator (pho family)-like protein